MWIQTPNERCCGTCGVTVELWVLYNGGGERVVEATFCPVCYPDLERIFHPPVAARSAA